MTRRILALSLVVTVVLAVAPVPQATANDSAGVYSSARAPTGAGVQATFEDNPPSGFGTVLHTGKQYVFLWGHKREGTIVARAGPSPSDLSEQQTVLDPAHIMGENEQPKFSAAYVNGTYHLLVSGHETTKVVYYRGSTLANLSRVETVMDFPEGDFDEYDTQQTYRNALMYHEGTWYFYLAQERWHAGDDTPDRVKETVIYTGPNLTALSDSGASINYETHPDLSLLSNVGSVWYDEDDGMFRAFVDGGDYNRGTHEHIFVANSPDGLNWTVDDPAEINASDISTGYNSRHVYAPSGVWVNGTFVGLAVGSETHDGPEYDRYDHDTSLFVTDDLRLTLGDYGDRVADPTPTQTPTMTETPTTTPTRTHTATPTVTPRPGRDRSDGSSGGGGGSSGSDWYPMPTQAPIDMPTPTVTETPAPGLKPVDVGPTPTPGTSDETVLRWLLGVLRAVMG